MRVVAINASPRMEKGNTALILTPFLEGMKEGGAEVELLYVKELYVHPCQGEYSCWVKTPGICFQKDDMQTVLPKLAQADVWVLAMPLYVDGMPGPMKTLIDRILPLVEPFFQLRDGHCRHPRRENVKGGKVVLVSNCGFWEKDNFAPLVTHVEAICKNADREFAGALLRPHGTVLGALAAAGGPVDDIFAAAREAGVQLASTGRIDRAPLEGVARELLPLEAYAEAANERFRQALESAR